ncbi:FAD/NAD(P)-binding protein [Streptomyces viridochromogenes]|uniref:FAD/NAD(P)-binding protein n=1 Tax=Streptomyces viridochromogenes TaxID=1938 RepID=UPI00069D72DA|nr:FAD/NAD(P)-binding protein [Streptomyces viridochromogenes]KOG20795.1 FAD binding domain-containing protein [Streptomyces viridochromogenes]KOG21429.1 FAD binding domain-containing protein [Streptomyces viridochromogenes]
MTAPTSAPTPEPPTVSLALVGAGPRGTSVLERLCASAPELLPPGTRLTVHVIDPAPPGPGRVWRTAQSPELLMNTVASQVTLFTDDSVDCSGPIRPGPSLYDWAAGELGPDEYPTRAHYGRYLEWVFAQVVSAAPPAVRVETYAARAVRLDDASDGSQVLTLDDGRVLPGLTAVVLAQGHLPTAGDATQRRLASYAERHGLRYVAPANPADVDLSSLSPGEPVLLRGLGLNFFDHTALLTTGRGGRFVRTEGGRGLRYLPSGNEPRLYAGSRRGIPYQARGDNAKGPYGRHLPLVLTPEVIAGFRKRADSGEAPDFLAEIWPLVAKEVETVYYAALIPLMPLTPPMSPVPPAPGTRRPEFPDLPEFVERFLAVPHRDPREADLLAEFGVPERERWSWDRISRPYKGREFADPGQWRDWLLAYLREDAAQAARGNLHGPLKAALDVLRDLRNELRLIVDHGGLTGTSRRDHLDRWYTPLNAFLSIGPPRRRVEELVALVEAGVVDVLGPRLEVREEEGAWVAHSPEVPGSAVRATALVEARLPEPDLRRSADHLLARLLKTGQCRPHVVDGHETGGVDVTQRPYRLIDRQGQAHARRFAFGVPTEGVHWVTAAGARPGVDSVTLSDADAVARAALRAVITGARGDSEAEVWPNVELARVD